VSWVQGALINNINVVFGHLALPVTLTGARVLDDATPGPPKLTMGAVTVPASAGNAAPWGR
jgi:hypothetical protein